MDAIRELTLGSMLLRIVLALAVGGILGTERGRKNRPAGFRTYMLVCLGAALVMMTNQYVFEVFGTSDPVRMGAQVVSGIGFLGAGTILVTGKRQVRGITTAAGLWAAACLGLAVGIGYYEAAIAGGLVVFVVMEVLEKLDILIRRNSRQMELYIELDSAVRFSSFIDYSREHQFELYDIQIQKNKVASDDVTCVLLTVNHKEKLRHNEMLEILSEAPGIHYIEELQ